MKKSATTLVGAAVLGLILSGAAWDSKAQGVKTGKAEVRSAGEGARYSTTANVWVPVKKGDKLPEGATIASSSSPVDLSLNDSIVRVQPNTTVRLDKLSGGSASGVKIVDTQLNLVDGRVTANIRKLAAGARYEVKTPNGVAGIRGTKIDVRTYLIDGKRLTIYSVVEGTMDVAETTSSGVKTAVVNAGESFVVGDFPVGQQITIPGVGTVTVGGPFKTPGPILTTPSDEPKPLENKISVGGGITVEPHTSPVNSTGTTPPPVNED